MSNFKDVNLQTSIGSLVMKNPVTTASGTFAAGREYSELFDITRLGAITTKGVSKDPWAGNASPRIAETPSGMLNSIGLQNPGVEVFCQNDLAWLSKKDVPIIVNVSGHGIHEYVEVVERLENEQKVCAYEINISCPNVASGGMAFGTNAELAAQVVRACRAATGRTLIVKLTPNVTNIVQIADAVKEAGADALSLINTLLGMAIDEYGRKPVLARKVGGLSGPAIKPVALRMVYEVHKAIGIPIVGMGGISNATDAIEFMLAGASAVAVGTASFLNPTAAIEVVEGLAKWCEQNSVKNIGEIVGALDE